MKKAKVVILTIALVLTAGCSHGFKIGNQADRSKPIIKVNESFITQKMFDKAMDMTYNSSQLPARNINLKDPKNKPVYLFLKGRVINELLMKALLQQEADRRNIKVSDEDIKKAMDGFIQRVGSKDKLEATLTLNNISKEDFINNLKIDIMTNKLVDNLMIQGNVNDQTALNFYNQNKNTKFKTPDIVKAQHILIGASEKDIKARLQSENQNMSEDQLNKKTQEELAKAKSKADSILAKVKQDPSQFETIAKSSSDDSSSAQKGGDLGYFSKDQMVPAFSKVAFSLAPGQISNVVKTDFGYHIIKVTDHKKSGIMPFIEVKEDIKKYMTNKEKVEVLQKLLVNLKNSAYIKYLYPEYDLNSIQQEINAMVKSMPKNPSLAGKAN